VVPEGVVMDIVELAPELRLGGLKETRDPDGAPLALNPTDWVTPEVTAVSMVLVAVVPAAALVEFGDAEIEKSLGAAAVTSRVKAVE
jgi:hypothetical protein